MDVIPFPIKWVMKMAFGRKRLTLPCIILAAIKETLLPRLIFIMTVLQGGKFGHGFASAGLSQASSGWIGGLDRGARFSPARIAASAVVGGTASRATGGKFANGALTGAFSRAFNDERHASEVRKKIARQAKELLTNKSEEYAYREAIGNFGKNTYKCNKFVYDAAVAAKANIDLNIDAHGNAWPPLADTWGNPHKEMSGWKIVDSPAPGDIVAEHRPHYTRATGHVGIIANTKLEVISAGKKGVYKGPLQTVFPGDSVVYRRYVGGNK